MIIHSFFKKKIAFTLALLLGVMLIAFQPAKVSAASLYSLQAKANNSYVSADNYGNNPLVANRTSASAWEQFQIINNTDGTISLLSMANNKYVTADLNQGAVLIARSTSIQQWEKFKKVTLADGTIALQAMANNQYVSTDLNNGAVLSANKTAVGGAWEAFSLVTSGSSTVSKPAEAPSYIWNYAVNADNRFGKNGDFALLICAVIKQETSYGADSSGPSGGDGLMQVEPNTRNAYSGEFSSTFGHAYNHNDQQDQVYLGAMILNDMINLAGANNIWRGLVNYNGGPNWYPGATDSYGRPILADQYANTVYGTYKNYGGLY